MKIEQLAIIGQSLETMRKAFRDKEAREIFRGQGFPMPLQECVRIGADIHCHVEDGASQTGDDLDLSVRRVLEMHASYSPCLTCERPVDLDDGLVSAFFLQFFLTV